MNSVRCTCRTPQMCEHEIKIMLSMQVAISRGTSSRCEPRRYRCWARIQIKRINERCLMLTRHTAVFIGASRPQKTLHKKHRHHSIHTCDNALMYRCGPRCSVHSAAINLITNATVCMPPSSSADERDRPYCRRASVLSVNCTKCTYRARLCL